MSEPSSQPLANSPRPLSETVSGPARAELLSWARADQHRRWQRGERILVEACLARYPALAADDDAVLDLIYSEVLLREENGEAPALDEYIRRFPRYEPALRRQFALHQALAEDMEPGDEIPEADDSGSTSTLGPVHAVEVSIAPRHDPAGESTATWKPAAEVPGKSTESSSDAVTPLPPRPEAGRKPFPAIPGYTVLGELGRGGMGIVYKAQQIALNRLVAIKMLYPGSGPGEVARFRAEAEAVAQLQHPNVVQIHEVSEADGRPYVALEFVAGGTLGQKQRGKPMAAREAARVMEVLARAVHAAHRRGIVHRDLKPSNVLLTPDGTPKVTDFGLAKRLDVDRGQTRSGDILGTPGYMAPEQAAGKNRKVGAQADVYGLGAVLYDVLTGRPPFRGEDLLQTLDQVLRQDPVPPARIQPNIPRALQAICLKCLEKEPALRYAGAEQLADELRRYLDGEPLLHTRQAGPLERAVRWVRRRPAVALLLGASGVALAGVLVGGGWSNPLAAAAVAILSLLVAGWWYSARLQSALRQLREHHAAAERHVERLHLLLETTRHLVSAPDLDTLLRLISETTSRMVNAERATIYFVDAERRELWSKVAMGDEVGEIRLSLGVGIAGAVAQTGETVNIPDASADQRFNPEIDRWTGYQTRNMLALPMTSRGGRIVGVFQLLNKRGGPFEAEDVDILSQLAASAAIAVENAQRAAAAPAGQPADQRAPDVTL